jgi:hypothetical protein
MTKYAREELPADADNLCTPFRTAYELSLAAMCLSDLGPTPTRASLFDAFVRRRCCGLVDPSLVRLLLSNVADTMHTDLQSSLFVDNVWRLGERVFGDQHEPVSTIYNVISCGLMEVRQGKCRFRHELLQRYFEAIALIRAATDVSNLVEELKRPVHHAQIELVLGMQSQPDSVRACLQAAAEANYGSHLFAACLHGRFGTVARNAVVSDCSKMLGLVEANISQLRADLTRDESNEQYTAITIAGAREWTAYDHALMNAVADSLPFGLFLEEVLHLVGETEQHLLTQLGERIGAARMKQRSFRSCPLCS